MTVKTDHIHWLGHDSIRIAAAAAVIYIDPWEVAGPPADLILITHDHYDHCDALTVKSLSDSKTMITADRDSINKLKAGGVKAHFTVMEPGDEIEFKGVNVKAVPSYNLDKNFHPRAKNNLGFILICDGWSVYHAGDSDFIPEMKNIKAQVALLPVSGTYVMTAEEAVSAALAINPEVAVPMHFGKIVGDEKMAAVFAEALAGKVKVEIKAVEK